MATYKSAKKQLDWAMECLEGELQAANENVEMYSKLLESAHERGNKADVEFWFKPFADASANLRILENLQFMITHPDIYNEDWK